MYCPSCGTPASADQKFCRSCGLSLQVVSQVVASQRPGAEPDKSLLERIAGHQSPRRRMLRRGFIVQITGMAVGITFEVIGGIIVRFDPSLGDFIKSLGPVGALVSLVGISLMVYSFVLPKRPSLPPQPTGLPQPQPTTKLLPELHPESIASVTEHTTELLEETDSEPHPRITARNK